MTAAGMPAGYEFKPQPNDVAAASCWQVHLGGAGADAATSRCSRRRTTAPASSPIPTCPRCGRTFSCSTGSEESQHAILDELEWKRENAKLSDAQRDQAVDDLIELVAAVDGIVQAQAQADADYFLLQAGRSFTGPQQQAIRSTLLAAYRWQYIFSGVQEPRFLEVLGSMITPDQGARINAALASIDGTFAN
jgi:hypothetical protein